MSTHEVPVIRIEKVEKHPNADALELVKIDGYTCAVKIGQFKPGDLAVYVEPDFCVPTEHKAFAFLGDHRRVKSRKFRGVWSQGLLLPVSDFPELSRVALKQGSNVMELLGITRYEPPMVGDHRPGRNGSKLGNSGAEKPHKSLAGIAAYDLESLRKHSRELVEGEPVYITEKIHGANMRVAWRDGRLWVGSRTQWKKGGEQPWWSKTWTRLKRWWNNSTRPNLDLDKGNVWWRVANQQPWIADWCRANQDCVLFGEVFGQVQDLKYGAGPDQLFFRAFDVMRDGKWLDAADFMACGLTDEQRAPVLYVGPYSREKAEELALRDSTLAPHLSEGVVVKPLHERASHGCGRVALKLVSDRYLSR